MTERKATTKKHHAENPSKKPLENLNSFLYKLWSLVNDETLSVIRWSQDGEKIIIENPVKFTAKVLNSYERKIFKTKNISSFIRQLNLYGFRRVKENCGKTPIIFKHECFKRGRMDLLADVKRKKPESNKSLSTKLITPPQKSYKSTAVQSHEEHDRSQVQSKPRYQYLSTAHNYPYPSQNLVRKNVHMPFITPFAVNPGSTFINLPGSSSTMFGKHGEQDEPARIAHSNTQDEEKQLLQQPENEKFDKTKIATETFSPWRHHSYQVTQEPATTPINTAAYGNEVGYQVMIQNQVKYANYTPTQSTNYVYSSLPLVTSYRNYGDNPESTYYPSLMNYNGPTNSIVSLPYRPPHMERSYNNVTTIKGHRSGIKSEHFPSCDSRFPEHSGNVFSNVNDEAESQCVSHENTAFTYITASDQEKECVEEKKR